MYTDGRSKKVAFVAHCLLNQNSISDGTAVYPAAFKDVIHTLLDADIGIVQLPCPELCCLGLDRGNPDGANVPVVEENTRIRRPMKEAAAANKLSALVDHTMLQINEYCSKGFVIVGIIGANRSPNCGVETTSDDNRDCWDGTIYAGSCRSSQGAGLGNPNDRLEKFGRQCREGNEPS